MASLAETQFPEGCPHLPRARLHPGWAHGLNVDLGPGLWPPLPFLTIDCHTRGTASALCSDSLSGRQGAFQATRALETPPRENGGRPGAPARLAPPSGRKLALLHPGTQWGVGLSLLLPPPHPSPGVSCRVKPGPGPSRVSGAQLELRLLGAAAGPCSSH